MKLSPVQRATLAAISGKQLAMARETNEARGMVCVTHAHGLVLLGLASVEFTGGRVIVTLTAAGQREHVSGLS